MKNALRLSVPVILSILAFGASAPSAFASDVATTSVPTVAEKVGGGIGWSPVNGALIINDGSVAESSSLATTTTSAYLKLSNFGFLIPSDATITGIEVSVVRRGVEGSAFIKG